MNYDDRNDPLLARQRTRRPPLPLTPEAPLGSTLHFDAATTYQRYGVDHTAGVLSGAHGSVPAVHHRQASCNHDRWSVYLGTADLADVDGADLGALLARCPEVRTVRLATMPDETQLLFDVQMQGTRTLVCWSLPILLCLSVRMQPECKQSASCP